MTVEQLENRIIKYLPTFIIQNEILEAIVKATAKALVRSYDIVTELKNADWIGKGLRLNAYENNIVFTNDDPDSDIQNKLIGRFNENQSRGTEARIIEDLKELTNDNHIVIEFYGPTECGFICGVTYPGIDPEAIINVNKLVVLTYEVNQSLLGSMVLGEDLLGVYTIGSGPVVLGSMVLGLDKLGSIPSNKVNLVKEIVREKILPIDVQIIYEEAA